MLPNLALQSLDVCEHSKSRNRGITILNVHVEGTYIHDLSEKQRRSGHSL